MCHSMRSGVLTTFFGGTMKRNRVLATAVAGLSLVIALPTLGVLGAGEAGAAPLATDEVIGTRSETFTIGPHTLQPAGQAGDEINQIYAAIERPEGDIAVRSIDWELIDSAGNALTHAQAHLHHIVLLDNSRPDELCGVPSRFAGTGDDLIKFELPEPYAYRSDSGDWQAVYNIRNSSALPLDVAVRYTVTYSDALVPNYRDVEPFFFDVDGCWGDSIFEVPGDGGPGSSFAKSNDYVMNRDATIVNGGGHLHDGGIDAYINDGATEICRATAVYDEDSGHFDGVEPCGVVNYDIDIGDVLTLTARYRNDEYIPDAMGIMVMYLEFTSPPPPPPTVEITSVKLVSGALVVTVVCNSTFDVQLYGSVRQTKGKTTISGSGYEGNRLPCGPNGASGTLALTGNGVLTGGSVAYFVEAYGFVGRDYTTDDAEGVLRLQGRIDLGVQLPDEGDLDITIDQNVRKNADGDRVVDVSVPCTGPAAEVEVYVSIRQRAGRQYASNGGEDYGLVECVSGLRKMAVTLDGTDRLVGGPAVVTTTVYVYGSTFEYSTRSIRVMLSGTTPPGNSTVFAPDPQSKVSITGVTRRDGSLVVSVTVANCVVGAYLQVGASLTDLGPRGRRISGPSTYAYSSGMTCDGRTAKLELKTFGDLATSRIGVRVQAYEQYEVDGQYVFQLSTNAGEFRV
jgi:hypothetical protein